MIDAAAKRDYPEVDPSTGLDRENEVRTLTVTAVYVTGSASAFGSRVVPSEDVDHAFGMPSGKLKSRAGIHSFAHVSENEDEGSLGEDVCRKALHSARAQAENLDWMVAASETHHAYPSLSAILHGRLGLRENCNALDVGSGCLALLQAFAVAQALFLSGRAQKILVATADVHSRTLGPGRAAGEFGGLFGDGASAFLLSANPRDAKGLAYRLGEFFFGCAAKYAEAIAVSEAAGGKLEVQFDGDALSRAAVSRMEKVIDEVEHRSGISRQAVGTFATHQPNPRLVTLLAKQLGVSLKHFPPIGTTRGNLGSSMCGAALHDALDHAAAQPADQRKPVFLASLGPGLLFGGGWMVPAGK
jgi:3-oxoacyl-[acyl-carrier-protein] synthase-3